MIEYAQTSIVIPAYNEENTITTLLKRIMAVSHEFEVIVCSDGSTDRTAELARALGAQVLEHPYNIGNGAAVKSGALAAMRDYIVFMDADLQHQPEDIPKLLEFMPRYDMVIGARVGRARTQWHRNVGNFVLKKVAENISGFRITDLTSGFRAVKRDVFLRFSNLYPLRYSYPSTSVLAFLCTGYFIKYVPLGTIVARQQGRSQIKPWRDGLAFLHIIVRLIMMFRPNKIFNPLALLSFLAGVGLSLYQLSHSGGIRSSGIILLISSLVIFLNGVLAEQLAHLRRDLKR